MSVFDLFVVCAGKGLSTRMDPHAWSDLPTDTDDEATAENVTSPAW